MKDMTGIVSEKGEDEGGSRKTEEDEEDEEEEGEEEGLMMKRKMGDTMMETKKKMMRKEKRRRKETYPGLLRVEFAPGGQLGGILHGAIREGGEGALNVALELVDGTEEIWSGGRESRVKEDERRD